MQCFGTQAFDKNRNRNKKEGDSKSDDALDWSRQPGCVFLTSNGTYDSKHHYLSKTPCMVYTNSLIA